MRIELESPDGYLLICDAKGPKILAEWFAEWLPDMVSVNSSYGEWRMRVWPTMGENWMELHTSAQDVKVTGQGLRQLAKEFMQYAAVMDGKPLTPGT